MAYQYANTVEVKDIQSVVKEHFDKYIRKEKAAKILDELQMDKLEEAGEFGEQFGEVEKHIREEIRTEILLKQLI